MRSEDAVYGGEMSTHRYFRDFAYSVQGWFPDCSLPSGPAAEVRPLAQMVEQRIYPYSSEINFKVGDATAVVHRLHERYGSESLVSVNHTDGLSMEFAD
jgi:phosphomannomutase